MTGQKYTDAVADQRFWESFWARTRPERWGCIEWRGPRNRGYGVTSRGRSLIAHRVAWMMANGADPGELVIDHLCCFKACVNPDHLEAVTSMENSQRHTRGLPGWVPVGVALRKVRVAEKHLYTPGGRLRQPRMAA